MTESTFRPLPLLGNPHVQTILGNLLRGAGKRVPCQDQRIPLEDGDHLLVHASTPTSAGDETPTVILVHGLGGDARSAYMLRLASLLLGDGFRVVRVNLRGAGPGLLLARRFYNAACSDDIRSVADWVQQSWPRSPIYLVGLSLGGNIVLKLAGESTHNPLPSLAGVVAVSAPIDLARCAQLLAKQPLYDRFYVRHLVDQVSRHQKLVPGAVQTQFPRKMTVRLFDELYTAPRGGYESADAYYAHASSFQWIGGIGVPAFLLTAQDDPFVAFEPYLEIPAREGLNVHVVPYGGHMGFLGADGAGGIRWAERRIVDWVRSHNK